MTQTQMSPCCAKFQVQLTRARAEVARLARIIARQVDHDGPRPTYVAQLKQAKQNVKDVQAHAVDHEAAHAGKVAV